MRLAIIFCVLSFHGIAGTFSQDSIGTEQKGDQVFILHEVADSETLYSVSRRYNVPIHTIIEHNPPVEFGLDAGQVIRVPYQKKQAAAVQKPAEDKSTMEPVEVAKDLTRKSDDPRDVQLPARPLVHKVTAKETLFSIGRLYNVAVADLKKWNGLVSNDLSIGQELVIHKTQPSVGNDTSPSEAMSNSKTHVVQPSETLYSIARLYEVSVNDLRKWNDLIGTEISIGQQLIVKSGGLQKDKHTNVVVKSDPKDTLQQKIVLIDTARYRNAPIIKTNFEEVVETGLAEQIEGTSGSRKYLALHRTAQTGTILRVKNEMNDQEIFVRVVGRLPDTSNNNNVVLKISKAAYDKLGAIDPKFRVKVTYIP